MKLAYIDIGELDFSIRLSAYIKWLKAQNQQVALVMTYPDRKCLYEDWVGKVIDLPNEFYKDFDVNNQWGSRILGFIKIRSGVRSEEDNQMLFNYFNEKLPEGYHVSEDMRFIRGITTMVDTKKLLFTPYPYKERFIGKKEILVFPRARRLHPHDNRNIPRRFYIKLIECLCDSFKDYTIRTMGLKFSAYSITEVERKNYINSVEENSSLQKVIDRCQIAIGAIGSHSTPLSFTLLQGVPTFIIGTRLEKAKRDNWLKTKYHFFSTGCFIFAKWQDEKAHDRAIKEAVLFFKDAAGYDRNLRQSSIIHTGA